MTLEKAQIYGQGVANHTGSGVLVYRVTAGTHEGEYGVAFTLPNFSERVGERIYPSIEGAQYRDGARIA